MLKLNIHIIIFCGRQTRNPFTEIFDKCRPVLQWEKHYLHLKFYVYYICPLSWAHNRRVKIYILCIKWLYQVCSATEGPKGRCYREFPLHVFFWILCLQWGPAAAPCSSWSHQRRWHSAWTLRLTSVPWDPAPWPRLVPPSLSFSTTEEGQEMIFTHSLSTESSYAELGAPQNKAASSLSPSHSQVTLWG